MFRIKDYMMKECKKEDVVIRELVNIKIGEDSDEEGHQLGHAENKELLEKLDKPKRQKAGKSGQVQPL